MTHIQKKKIYININIEKRRQFKLRISYRKLINIKVYRIRNIIACLKIYAKLVLLIDNILYYILLF